MKNTVRNTIGVFVVIAILLGAREWMLRPDGKMHAVFLDVGQGDSALVTFRDGTRMLVDGGPDWSTLEALGKRLPFFDRRIDIVVLSHPNSDHMTALPEVLRRYRVQTLVTGGTPFDSGLYHAVLSGAALRGIAVTAVQAGDTIAVGDADMEILWPTVPRPAGLDRDVNNDSVYLMLKESGKRILFTGDGESVVEKTLVAAHADLHADVLKIGHHGSTTSSSTGFLLAVHPTTAVVSVGEGNPYHHPSAAVMQRLRNLGIDVRRTDEQGDIEIVW